MSYQECISGFNWFPDIENSLKIKWISRELFTAIMQTFSLPEKSNGISRSQQGKSQYKISILAWQFNWFAQAIYTNICVGNYMISFCCHTPLNWFHSFIVGHACAVNEFTRKWVSTFENWNVSFHGFSYLSHVRKRVSRMCYFPNGGFKGTSQNSACTYEGII